MYELEKVEIHAGLSRYVVVNLLEKFHLDKKMPAIISLPLVSVVLSCYNGSRWLHEAIESVLAQTFENFEFIIVNDGSTDGSWQIIQKYRGRDERIVAISKNNSGLADSLNVGIAKATGAWIARLDADDFCEPKRFEEQLRFVQGHPEVVLLGSGFVEIDYQSRKIEKHLYPSGHRKLVQHVERSQRFFPHSSAFFKREVAQAAGNYNTLFKRSQDRDLWLRFAERGKVACLKDDLVRIRKHSKQISNSQLGALQLVYGTAASICHFLRIQGYSDPSNSSDKVLWQVFIAWIGQRMVEEGIFDQRKAWTDARVKYFASDNKLINLFRFTQLLVRSGYACKLVWEKFFGSSLSQQLAQEWMNKIGSAKLEPQCRILQNAGSSNLDSGA